MGNPEINNMMPATWPQNVARMAYLRRNFVTPMHFGARTFSVSSVRLAGVRALAYTHQCRPTGIRLFNVARRYFFWKSDSALHQVRFKVPQFTRNYPR